LAKNTQVYDGSQTPALSQIGKEVFLVSNTEAFKNNFKSGHFKRCAYSSTILKVVILNIVLTRHHFTWPNSIGLT